MSLKTDNFKLFKYEDNDTADLRFINDSMDIIDKGINPFYVATLDSTNTYKITTGLNKTSLANGYSVKVAIPTDSTGAVSIIVDSVTVPVKKPNGNAVTNFKQNGVYSLTYYNSVFILASGGVDDVNFTSDKLLTGYTANNSNGEKINGTMPNKGAVTHSLSANGSLTLPSGYYDSIKVTQNIPNRGEYQMAGGIGSGTDYITLNKIPYGYYPQSSNGWAPEIRAKKTDVANSIGLTADKIVKGNNILGVNGTATIESLGGKTIKTKEVILKSGNNVITADFNIVGIYGYVLDYENIKKDISYTRTQISGNTQINVDGYNFISFNNFYEGGSKPLNNGVYVYVGVGRTDNGKVTVWGV